MNLEELLHTKREEILRIAAKHGAYNAYASGDIGLGKAAAMLGVSQEEMKDMLRETGAAIHLGPQTTAELMEDARNA